MSIASEAGQVVSHYRGSVAGYDATGAQLRDFSGNGLHLPKLAGAVSYGTYSGVEAMRLRGDVPFGPPLMDGVPVYPFPTRYTQIGVVWISLSGADNYWFVRGMHRDTAANDPAWKTPTTAFDDSADQGLAVGMFASGNGFSARGGSPNWQGVSAYASGAWNVCQFVVDPDGSQYRFRIGNEPWAVAAIASGFQITAMDDFRLGNKTTPIDVTAGRDFALAQLITLAGDSAMENSQGYDALIAALMADPTA